MGTCNSKADYLHPRTEPQNPNNPPKAPFHASRPHPDSHSQAISEIDLNCNFLPLINRKLESNEERQCPTHSRIDEEEEMLKIDGDNLNSKRPQKLKHQKSSTTNCSSTFMDTSKSREDQLLLQQNALAREPDTKAGQDDRATGMFTLRRTLVTLEDPQKNNTEEKNKGLFTLRRNLTSLQGPAPNQIAQTLA